MNNFFKSLSCFDWEDSNDDIDFNIYHTSPINLIFNDNFQEMNIPGLSNFEGNCYLNSILQCFYYCNDLTKYFINNEKEIINKGGKLSNAYLKLILKLNKKEKYNDAKIFLNTLKEVSYNFFKKGGNDPKAVLFYLLENLHNELKDKNMKYNEEDICCEDIDQDKAFEKCKNNEENNKSIISELFNWCMLTKNECIKCGNTHYTCEYKNTILIELNKYESFKQKMVSILDLINFYFSDVENHFICNTDTEVIKAKFTKKIISLPQYLIIILNRNILKFEIAYEDIIDLSEYCINENKTKYKFIGACLTNDFGNNLGTHAVSRCITSEGSYIFNDLLTYKNCNDIKRYNPYILFYQKI